MPPVKRGARRPALRTRQPVTAAVIANGPAQIDVRVSMQPDPQQILREVLAGLVERVTFHNEENGFCVLRT
jgi:hypothetical protein